MLAEIPLGEPVEVEITIKEKDGQTYRDIKRVIGYPSPKKAGPTPGPTKTGGYDDITGERIFCCGIVNNLVGHVYDKHGTITPEQMVAITQAARFAWMSTFGRKVDD